MSVAVVIPAAGMGRRLGSGPKAFLEVAGHPLLRHTLQPFLACADVDAIVVALAPSAARQPPPWLAALRPRVTTVAGGDERGDSVYAALRALHDRVTIVLVHDAARPLVSTRVIGAAIAAVRTGRSVAVGVPVADTIQQVDADRRIVSTPAREPLWQAQTPQAFARDVILSAYERARAEGVRATDDAAVVRRYGTEVFMLEGERDNIKITTPADLELVQAVLRARP